MPIPTDQLERYLVGRSLETARTHTDLLVALRELSASADSDDDHDEEAETA